MDRRTEPPRKTRWRFHHVTESQKSWKKGWICRKRWETNRSTCGLIEPRGRIKEITREFYFPLASTIKLKDSHLRESRRRFLRIRHPESWRRIDRRCRSRTGRTRDNARSSFLDCHGDTPVGEKTITIRDWRTNLWGRAIVILGLPRRYNRR